MKMMSRNEAKNRGIMVVAVDHGYGNIKGTGFVFRSGVMAYEKEPTFNHDMLKFNGKFYQIGAEHKEFIANKMQDEDYYILTLAAIAREMNIRKVYSAKVHLAAGLPLTWVSEQKEAFKEYLLQNKEVDFTFRGVDYHVEFVGADVFPQGFAAVVDKLRSFKGINMLADIGNGTMNIMYINDCRPVEKKCYTEKYGTNQCILEVKETLLKRFGTVVDDTVIEQVLRFGNADISVRYLEAIQESARNYVSEIFRKLREHEYNPELMRLYVVGGGSCMIENFGDYEKDRVTIICDICAMAKGYELLATKKLRKNGVIA